MKNKRYLMLTGVCATMFIGVLVAAGCGGGGPATPQVAVLGTVSAFKALLPAGQKLATPVGTAACAKCHAADCTSQSQTKHAAASVNCESCHGPGSAHAAAPGLNNILNGVNAVSPAVCAQCHSTEANDWNASVHAQFVSDPVDSGSNNCLRCHSDPFHTLNIESPLAHGQTPAQINAAISALTSAQLMGYAPATHDTISCAGCHDPHQNTANLTSAGNQFYLRAATSSTDLSSDPPGASVASYTTVNHVCGMCHNNRGGDPSDAGLTKSTSRPATHEGPEYNMLNGVGGAEGITTTGGSTYAAGTAPPAVRTSSHVDVPDQCVTCHMPNARHTFTVSLDVSCAPCHTAADAASRANATQTQVQNTLANLEVMMEDYVLAQPWNTAKDPSVWDYSSNLASTSKFPPQSDIPIELKRARHNYYFIIVDRSYGVHNFVYTQYLLNQSIAGLESLGVTPPPAQSKQAVASRIARSQAIAKAGHMSQSSMARD